MKPPCRVMLALLASAAVCDTVTAFQTPCPQLLSSSAMLTPPTPHRLSPLSMSSTPEHDGNVTPEHDEISEPTSIDTTTSTGERWAPLPLKDKIALPLNIVASVYLLLLLPSGFALGQLCGAKVMGTLPYEYIFFFSVLILPRAYQYGEFDKPNIEETPTISAIAPLLFGSSLVGAHWIAAYQHAISDQGFLVPEIFLSIRILSTILVAASGLELGRSYDRVTNPDALVSSGPYALVRNPIYTSYFFFFTSALLMLRSYAPLAVLLPVSAIFYDKRIGDEEQILEETFGEDFERYKQQVPWRLFPFVY